MAGRSGPLVDCRLLFFPPLWYFHLLKTATWQLVFLRVREQEVCPVEAIFSHSLISKVATQCFFCMFVCFCVSYSLEVRYWVFQPTLKGMSIRKWRSMGHLRGYLSQKLHISLFMLHYISCWISEITKKRKKKEKQPHIMLNSVISLFIKGIVRASVPGGSEE